MNRMIRQKDEGNLRRRVGSPYGSLIETYVA